MLGEKSTIKLPLSKGLTLQCCRMPSQNKFPFIRPMWSRLRWCPQTLTGSQCQRLGFTGPPSRLNTHPTRAQETSNGHRETPMRSISLPTLCFVLYPHHILQERFSISSLLPQSMAIFTPRASLPCTTPSLTHSLPTLGRLTYLCSHDYTTLFFFKRKDQRSQN